MGKTGLSDREKWVTVRAVVSENSLRKVTFNTGPEGKKRGQLGNLSLSTACFVFNNRTHFLVAKPVSLKMWLMFHRQSWYKAQVQICTEIHFEMSGRRGEMEAYPAWV